MIKAFTRITALLVCFVFVCAFTLPIFAEETPTPSPTATPTSSPSNQPSPTPNNDAEVEQTKRKIEELQKKLDEINGQKVSLTNTIQYINTKINLSQAQINKSEAELKSLEHQLQDLDTRIGGLEESLNILSNVLLARVNQQYKQKQTNPVQLLLISDGLNEFLTRYRYTEIAQDYTKEVMEKAENQKLTFDEQKKLKAQKQEEVEKKQQQLETQRGQLASERSNQQQLLTSTKNDEARYQQLLAQAEAELNSFRSFSSSRGTGILPPQNSPDGWYFSQRDQRWATICIGSSCGTRNEGRILEVGCLVSSTAMVKKKFGEDVNPITIARNAGYFFSNTAYMNRPWPAPGGYEYVRQAYSQAKMDSELAEGRPVIVHLRIGTADGHFVVIKSGENGNYTMHDPIEGYDKKFTDFYRISQINNMNYLRKI